MHPLRDLDAICAAALRRVYKSIDLGIARVLWKPGKPSPTRSVGQLYRNR